MTDKEGMKYKLLLLVPITHRGFWRWYDNKFCKYDTAFDVEDIRVLTESIEQTLLEEYDL